MADDLGMQGVDVHAKAREVLEFWFALTPEQHFAKSETLDREIAARFSALRDFVLASNAAGWKDSPETLLAATIVLDQFSRNIHRGRAAAFAADPLARELALEAIDQGWDETVPDAHRQFLYLPLMHAEDRELQSVSVAKYEDMGDPGSLKFARDHADVIARFGRFPSRNEALGRKSTPAEEEYLSQPGAGW